VKINKNVDWSELESESCILKSENITSHPNSLDCDLFSSVPTADLKESFILCINCNLGCLHFED
jgi:hypothetical protein